MGQNGISKNIICIKNKFNLTKMKSIFYFSTVGTSYFVLQEIGNRKK